LGGLLVGLSNFKPIKCFLGGFTRFSKAPCEPEKPILYFLVKLHLIYGIVIEIQKGRDQKANAQETPS